MKTVEEIKVAVARLSEDDLAAFRDWFWEYDNDAWDRQFEADALSGRLDEISREALQDLSDGHCTDLFDGDPNRSKSKTTSGLLVTKLCLVTHFRAKLRFAWEGRLRVGHKARVRHAKLRTRRHPLHAKRSFAHKCVTKRSFVTRK